MRRWRCGRVVLPFSSSWEPSWSGGAGYRKPPPGSGGRERNPRFAKAHTNLGRALEAPGRWDEARASHERALALDPGLAPEHVNRGLALLAQGNLAEGWSNHECHWQWRRSWPLTGAPLPPGGSPATGRA